jgi:hypothetical protein
VWSSRTLALALVWVPLWLLAVACGSEPAGPTARFVDHGDGTFTDQRTGLMWASRDNGRSVDWDAASSYAENFEGGGHTDWRLPDLRELTSLYDPRRGGYVPECTKTDARVHVPPVVQLSCALCWASTHDDYNAELFNFFHGKRLRMNRQDPYGDGALALPVRSAD